MEFKCMTMITNVVIHKLLTPCTSHACNATICDIWYVTYIGLYKVNHILFIMPT